MLVIQALTVLSSNVYTPSFPQSVLIDGPLWRSFFDYPYISCFSRPVFQVSPLSAFPHPVVKLTLLVNLIGVPSTVPLLQAMAPKTMAIRWSVHQDHAPNDALPLPTNSHHTRLRRSSSPGSDMSLDKPYHTYHTLSALQRSRSFDPAARGVGTKHAEAKSGHRRMLSKSSLSVNKSASQIFRKLFCKTHSSRSEVVAISEPNATTLEAAPVDVKAAEGHPVHAQNLRSKSQRDAIERQRTISTASSQGEISTHSSAPSGTYLGSTLPKAVSELSLEQPARVDGPQHSAPSLVSSGPSPISSPSLSSTSIPSIPLNNSGCSTRVFPGKPSPFDGDAYAPAATITTVCYASPKVSEHHPHILTRPHRRSTTPPRLASAGPRTLGTLRLFPTPAPPQDLPIARCKHLSLAPDPDSLTTHLRPQLATRRNASTSQLPRHTSNFSSSTKSLGHNRKSGSESGNRTAGSSYTSRQSTSGHSTSSEEREPTLKEWELDSFALRYEDTAKCGEPFRTKRAAELRWGKRW